MLSNDIITEAMHNMHNREKKGQSGNNGGRQRDTSKFKLKGIENLKFAISSEILPIKRCDNPFLPWVLTAIKSAPKVFAKFKIPFSTDRSETNLISFNLSIDPSAF